MTFYGVDSRFDNFVLPTNREIEEDIVSGGIEEIAGERNGIKGFNFDEG